MENLIEDFESFYSERLKPHLENLEPESNVASEWMVAGIAALFLCVACFIIRESATAIFFILLFIFSIYKFFRKKEHFDYHYKETVIKEIIEYLNPGALYEPLQMMAQRDYEVSGLYPRRYDEYAGEDLIRGVYKNVTYYCSELETSQYAGARQGHLRRIFKGLFFAARTGFGYGATYVWPADDVQLPVSIADYHFERFIPLPDIAPVDMKNAEFESYYTVYSTDSSSAMKIINNGMMARMIRFRNQIGRDVRFSFVNGICFVSIALQEDLLEPSVSDPLDKEKIKEYFFSVLLILSIINQLDMKSLV